MLSTFRNIRNSVIFSWLASYISILLIPIIISGIVYNQSVHIMKNQVTRINDAMIEQLQQAVDGQITNMEKISTQIALNSKLMNLVKNSTSNPVIDFSYSERIKQLFQDFNIYTLSNSFIKDFYVYIHDSDIVLTSGGYYTGRSFFDAEMQFSMGTYESWRSAMLKPYYNQYIVESELGSTENNSTITLLRSLPLQSEKFKATLAVSINRDELLKLVQSVNWANQDMFFILDNHNQILFSTQSTQLPGFVNMESMTKRNGVLYGQFLGHQVAVTYMKSGSGEWNYISITKTSLFNERVAYIRKLMLICLFLCVVIGGLIALWFTKKNYNPLSQLIKNVSSNAGFRLEKSQNEYRFLNEAFSSAISEKQLSDRRFEQQISVMRSSFIARLLQGRTGSLIPMDEALKMYRMPLDKPGYAVILFYIDDYSKLMVHASDEDNLRLAEFIVHNVVEEMVTGDSYRGYAAEVNNFIACLMNLDDLGEDILYSRMEENIRNIQGTLLQKFQIRLTAAISQIHPTAAGVYDAYQESLEAIEYKLLKGSGSIIRFDKINQSKATTGAYSYSLESERVLTNSIKSGDYGQALRIVEQLFESNVTNGELSLQIAKCLMFDLVGTMIKTMNELSSIVEPAFIEELNPMERLLNCNTFDDLHSQIQTILMKVCSYINEKSKENSNQTKLRDMMIAFIENQYHDGNLSLSMVAEHTGLSAKYVSAFFKQATGEGLSSYINKVRLNKAKCLLLEPNLNISEIAVKVGFTNSNALIRAFNKYEGITPGQFRDLARTD